MHPKSASSPDLESNGAGTAGSWDELDRAFWAFMEAVCDDESLHEAIEREELAAEDPQPPGREPKGRG